MKNDIQQVSNSPLLILSPMAGITDLPFRLVCKEHGADVLYSEMISATGLFYNPKASLQLAKSIPEDAPLFLQLFGNVPEHFVHAAKLLSTLEENAHSRRPEGLDINFGCPVPKVMKQGSGCNLMRDPELSYNIIKAVTDNTDLPVSIKIRAGIENVTALDFLEKVADLPWKTVIIHSRTYNQGFSGPIDAQMIKNIKKKYPDKTIIANGGIFSPEAAKKVLEETNADGIAIARGAYGNPWIFQQIKDYLQTGAYSKPSQEEITQTALKHAQLILDILGNEYIIEIRKHLGWYFKGFENAKELRKSLYSVSTLEEIQQLLESIRKEV